jgi:two-component system cell cycle response regulator
VSIEPVPSDSASLRRTRRGELPARLDVLVVDGDDVARASLVAAVRALGHVCTSARDGEEAWRLLQAKKYDVVISDWNVPGMTGTELCRAVRATEDGTAYTYFVLLTELHDRARVLEVMTAGADDYQTKPLDRDELEARLVAAARLVALHRRLGARERDLRRDSRQLWAASRTDTLTGVGNRLRMEEELAGAISRARRYGHVFSLAIVDVDLFKKLNDGFGHLAGDEALRQIASALERAVRTGDSVFRYGGEEFVVLLPEQSIDAAAQALERIRSNVEALRIRRPDGTILTVSAGVAELDPDADSRPADWLERADAALYRAKAAGRNRVETWRPVPVLSAEHGAAAPH